MGEREKRRYGEKIGDFSPYLSISDSPVLLPSPSQKRSDIMSVLTWVIYDIVENKTRSKVAKTCKQMGLIRVQKSVFLGKLENNRFDELGEICLDLIDENSDSVYLFPFCQEDFRKIKVLGQGFDKKLVNDDVLAMFF